jgi:acyl-CoA reductase-like NAD-dependent aldehyde dehydrogenase
MSRRPATAPRVARQDLGARLGPLGLVQGPWPRSRAGERVRVLRTIANLVREHADELLKLQALDNSVPLSFGEIYAMSSGFVADVFDHHAGWADKLAGETLPPFQGGDHMVLTLREPVGVVGAAQTRALVHRDAMEEFLATAELIGTMVSYGNPFDPEVTSAPLINPRQLDRVLGLIARGQEEGARLICGGGRAEGDELAEGNFVAPTLFADVSNDMSIAREEIFGPVLSVIPFDGEEEAVRLANDTDYGLAATVWTSDVRRAMRMTKAIKAGTVGVNGYQLEPNSPFGGFGQSGLGREGGRAAVESYTELKTVLLPFTDEMM